MTPAGGAGTEEPADDPRPEKEAEAASTPPHHPQLEGDDSIWAADTTRGGGHPEQPAGGLGGLLAQLEAMSEELGEASRAAADTIVEGSSAGGAVVIQLTGEAEAVSVRIDSSLVDPGDVAMLEDAVLAALRDGLAQVAELREALVDEAEGAELELGTLLNQLGGLANLGGLGSAGLEALGSPEDLVAGLAGAFGLPGSGEEGGLPGSLGDILAGLGLGDMPARPRPPSAGDQPADSGTEGGGGGEGGPEDEREVSGDDTTPAGGAPSGS